MYDLFALESKENILLAACNAGSLIFPLKITLPIENFNAFFPNKV